MTLVFTTFIKFIGFLMISSFLEGVRDEYQGSILASMSSFNRYLYSLLEFALAIEKHLRKNQKNICPLFACTSAGASSSEGISSSSVLVSCLLNSSFFFANCFNCFGVLTFDCCSSSSDSGFSSFSFRSFSRCCWRFSRDESFVFFFGSSFRAPRVKRELLFQIFIEFNFLKVWLRPKTRKY